MAIGNNIVTIIDARTLSHSVTKTFVNPNIEISGGWISQDYLWIATEDNGLYGWLNNPQWTPIERFDSRRADPLTMGFNLVNQEITNMTHPGMQIQLADVLNPILLDENSNHIGSDLVTPGGLMSRLFSSVRNPCLIFSRLKHI